MQEQINTIEMYTTNTNEVFVKGLYEKEVLLEVYSLLGKKVFTTHFNGTGNNRTSLPKIATGVYIVKLQSKVNGSISKKIIIQ